MSALRSFRPWRFRNPDHLSPATNSLKSPEEYVSREVNVTHLTLTPRKGDDRSQFVRFARAIAVLSEWIKDGTITRDEVDHLPEELGMRYGVCRLSDLIPTQSVLPSKKEERQRLLEGTQMYFEPILVTPSSDNPEKLLVVGNHDLYAAAVGFQEDMARPGKERPSDFALVAVIEQAELVANTLQYGNSGQISESTEALEALGFVRSNEDSALTKIEVTVQDTCWQLNGNWTEYLAQQLRAVLGVRSLDLNTVNEELTPHQNTLRMPDWNPNSQFFAAQSPCDSYSIANVPQAGAIMWSLRDF